VHSQLIEILAHKRKEIATLKKVGRRLDRRHELSPLRDFKKTLSTHGATRVIAEVKFASPSTGPIRVKTDPVLIGKSYERGGASAISFLTDKRFFGGDLKQLPRFKQSLSLPVLRKDFILDPCQVIESFTYGADAILLIAKILSEKQLGELMNMASELGMAVLTEVHDASDVEKALATGADIIGINNRDLETFEVDIKTTVELVRMIPKDRFIVSESGINSAEDMRLLKRIGVHAALVGTALMKSRDPEVKTKELVEAAK